MFDYEQPDNKVRCLMTQLKNAIDAEHQDNMRDKAELHDVIASLEKKCKQKEARIEQLTYESEYHISNAVFMSMVACVSVIFMFMHAVWC